MNKFLLPLTLVAVASLSACATQRAEVRSAARDARAVAYVSPTEQGAMNNGVRYGKGRVAYVIDPTGPVDGISWQRLWVNMEDKTQQVVDRRGQQIAIGEHVDIRSDNTIRREERTSKASP